MQLPMLVERAIVDESHVAGCGGIPFVGYDLIQYLWVPRSVSGDMHIRVLIKLPLYVGLIFM